MSSSTKCMAALLGSLVLSSCTPPSPTLAKLSSPVLSMQRRLGGPLLVVLSYDDEKTPCGTIENLAVSLDGAVLAGSPGKRLVDEKTGAESCEFPNFGANLNFSGQPRTLTVTDGATTMVMTADTLEVGGAIAQSPPATIKSGSLLRWSTNPPSTGTTGWKVDFTPAGGAAQRWTEGTSIPATVEVTVPAVDTSVSGTIALSWTVKTAVTKCEAVASCDLFVQGASLLQAVLAP